MKKTTIILAAIAAIVSCQKEGTPDVPMQDADQICFELDLPATKATATAFEAGDQAAVYAVEYDPAYASDETYAPEVQIAGNFINNAKLTYTDGRWTPETKLYWSDKPCDFYAVYPYQYLTSVEEHSFEVAADQNTPKTQDALGGYEASDIMWAKATKVSRDAGKVALQFKHLMSKCVVTITKGDKFEGEIPDDIVTHIYNTSTSAILDFAAGSLQKDGNGPRKTITMKKISNERFEAIVVPQNIERRTPLIEVTMGGIAYLLEYSLSFKPGYVHTINLIVNTSPDQEKIEIAIDASTGDMN